MKAGKEKVKTLQPVEKNVEQLFSLKNYLVFGFGFILLIAGYFMLAQPAKDPSLTAAEGFWSLNIAPVILILVYLVVIPVGILMRKSRVEDTES